jgi:hypothetical protein
MLDWYGRGVACVIRAGSTICDYFMGQIIESNAIHDKESLCSWLDHVCSGSA